MTRPPRISRTAARPIVCEVSMFSSSMLALSSSAAWVRTPAASPSLRSLARRAASAAARPRSGASRASARSVAPSGCPLATGPGGAARTGAEASQAGALVAASSGVASPAPTVAASAEGGSPPGSSKETETPPGMTIGSSQPVGVMGARGAVSMGVSSKAGGRFDASSTLTGVGGSPSCGSPG